VKIPRWLSSYSHLIAKAEITAHGQPPYSHIIRDFSERVGIDKRLFVLNTIQQMSASYKDLAAIIGWTLIVDPQPHPAMNLVATVVTQVARAHFRLFTNMDAAVAFLYEMDTTLPPRASAAPTTAPASEIISEVES